jgi:septal ring factor EnvC (AmiA/AmiB activator)
MLAPIGNPADLPRSADMTDPMHAIFERIGELSAMIQGVTDRQDELKQQVTDVRHDARGISMQQVALGAQLNAQDTVIAKIERKVETFDATAHDMREMLSRVGAAKWLLGGLVTFGGVVVGFYRDWWPHFSVR